MIRKVITKPKVKVRKLSKREEDGSLTKMLTLEVNGLNKLHSIEEPALVNKEQRKKEYYLNGIQYSWNDWNEIKKGRTGLPPSKKPAPKGFTNRS
jgi:hypothetical protein